LNITNIAIGPAVRTGPPPLGEVSHHMPLDVANDLVAASQVPNPTFRLVAIDNAVARAKARHPAYFRQDP
jgi:hypothetical protein